MKFTPFVGKLSEGDEYELSSGKRFYANNGIIGIGPDAVHVSEGYDGGVCIGDWTPTERAELADYMIELWTAFKKTVPITLHDPPLVLQDGRRLAVGWDRDE